MDPHDAGLLHRRETFEMLMRISKNPNITLQQIAQEISPRDSDGVTATWSSNHDEPGGTSHQWIDPRTPRLHPPF